MTDPKVPAGDQTESRELILRLLGEVEAGRTEALTELMNMQSKERDLVRRTIREHVGLGDRKLVAMFDLDATLFDSKDSRENAGANAILALELRIGKYPMDQESAKKLFKTVYNGHAEFKKAGFPDFRQVWNTAQMYAVVAALVDGGDARGRRFETKEGLEHFLDLVSTELLKDQTFIRQLTSRTYEILNNSLYADRLAIAMQEFDSQGLTPYPDARVTLQTMSELLGADIYVVTEGHDATQKRKLKMLGLSEFFDNNRRVLSTERICSPWRELADLKAEKARLDEVEREVTRALASAAMELVGAQERDDKARLSEARGNFDKAKRDWERFSEESRIYEWAMKMLERRAAKGGGAVFYSDVLHMINLRPEDPCTAAGFGAAVPGEWNRNNSFIAVMVGDRHGNDILPLRRLAPNVITCMLKIGSYRKEYEELKKAISALEKALEGGQANETAEIMVAKALGTDKRGRELLEFAKQMLPALEAETLSGIAGMLLCKNAFAQAQVVAKPKRFVSERLTDYDLEMTLLASLSRRNAISLANQGMLREASYDPQNIRNALEFFSAHLDDEHLDKEHATRNRTELKCAVCDIIATLLERGRRMKPDERKALLTRGEEVVSGLFLEEREEAEVRTAAVMAYGRFSSNIAPLEKLTQTNLMEFSSPFRRAVLSVLSQMKSSTRWETVVETASTVMNEQLDFLRKQTADEHYGEKYRAVARMLGVGLRSLKGVPGVEDLKRDMIRELKTLRNR